MFGLFALLVYLQYYFDLDLRTVIEGIVLFGFAWLMLFYAFADDGPQWAALSIAGLLMLLAVLPFWRAHREKTSGKREKTIADKLFFYAMALALALAVIRQWIL
ncbi:MAG: hypothetical protein ACR2QR_12080 [Woeseiaceae bacterium]